MISTLFLHWDPAIAKIRNPSSQHESGWWARSAQAELLKGVIRELELV